MIATKHLSILVVDDEAGIRELVKRCLNDERFSLVQASGGQEALECAGSIQHLQLLITDQKMPGMSGDDLARRLRARQPNLKVLYLTAHADHLFDAKHQLWDLEAYLEKPFTPEGLREAVALLMFGRTTLYGGH